MEVFSDAGYVAGWQILNARTGDEAQAQIEAFDDTWTWSQQSLAAYSSLTQGGAPGKVADALVAMREVVGDNDVLAYLVMMTARLLELRRVLKPTGSLYLHCDPTASHYLKVMLDAVFGPLNFRNEVIWQRTNARTVSGYWGRIHDVLLFYGKTRNINFRAPLVGGNVAKMPHTLITGPDGLKYQTYELTAAELRPRHTVAGSPWRGVDPAKLGRHWANSHSTMDEWDAQGLIHWPKKRGGFPRRRAELPFIIEERKVPVGDVWTDIDRLNQTAKERLGYPTQKPVSLLKRIIEASTNEGDLVLDPFCGCGTAIDAAQRLDRRWIGIDITYLAIDLIENRLRGTYGDEIKNSYKVAGIPQDVYGAEQLFLANKFDFERWAVSLVDGQPNEKQVGDRGVDGVVRFPLDNKDGIGRALVSVKGGKQMNPAMVRDLAGTVQHERAEMGILICMAPTPGMAEAARASGSYEWQLTGRTFPRVQIVTVSDLLAGKRPSMPTPFQPYLQAKRLVDDNQLIFDM
jgi:DNA modification methylase